MKYVMSSIKFPIFAAAAVAMIGSGVFGSPSWAMEDEDGWSDWTALGEGYVGRKKEPNNPVKTAAQNQKELDKAFKPKKIKAAWMHTDEEGLHAVSITELAAVLGKKEKDIRKEADKGELILKNGGEPVSWYFDKDNDQVVFTGKIFENINTDLNAYHIKKGKKKDKGKDALAMDETNGPTPGTGSETSFSDSLYFGPETALESDPEGGFFQLFFDSYAGEFKYFFWDVTFAAGGTNPDSLFSRIREIPLLVPNPSGTGVPQLRINLRGRTDIDRNDPVNQDDHKITAKLNGNDIGFLQWDGQIEVTLIADIDPSYLQSDGNNLLVLESSAPNGKSTSQLLHSIEVDYERNPVAVDGQIWLHNVAGGVQKANGFGSNEIMVVETPGGGDSVMRKDVLIENGPDGFMVSFDADPGKDYLIADVSGLNEVASLIGDEIWNLSNPKNEVDYLIIAPRLFAGTVLKLATHRSYHFSNVGVVWLNEIEEEFNHGRKGPEAITKFMEVVQNDWKRAPQYVVIPAKATYDHRNRHGYGDSYVPTQLHLHQFGLAASDDLLLNGDVNTTFASGRIPIVSDADGMAYVDKLIAYESTLPGPERLESVLVADADDPNAGFFHANSDILSAKLLAELGFTGVTPLYHPDDPVKQELDKSATWETGYVSYDGHGSTTRLGRFAALFNAIEKDGDGNITGGGLALENSALPIFSALTCAAGSFYIPGTTSVASALVLNPNGGAIASMSPTGLSFDLEAQQFNDPFVDSLFGDVSTIGEAVQFAKQSTVGFPGDRQYMRRIYTVIGEPAVYSR